MKYDNRYIFKHVYFRNSFFLFFVVPSASIRFILFILQRVSYWLLLIILDNKESVLSKNVLPWRHI